jgi:hypothetical protein
VKRDRRLLTLALCTLPVLGCLCLVVASCWYPGGSWWNAHLVGASFFDTFLCDLMRRRAINGTPNPVGSVFGQLGMALLALALVPAWWLVGPPRLSHAAPAGTGSRLARAARVFGLAGLVPLTVGLAIPGAWLHAVLVPAAGLLELIALALVTAATVGDPRRRLVGALGLAAIVVLVAGLGFYWPTMWLGELAYRGLPGVQKLGVLTLVAWMGAVARDAWVQ